MLLAICALGDESRASAGGVSGDPSNRSTLHAAAWTRARKPPPLLLSPLELDLLHSDETFLPISLLVL